MTRVLPDSSNEVAVKRLADEFADEIEAIKAQRARGPAIKVISGLDESREAEEPIWSSEEEKRQAVAENMRFACELALDGDIELLTKYLFARGPLDDITETTIHLLWAAYGEPEPRRGRPRMSEEERRKRTPTHDAAAEVAIIRKILHREFTNATVGDVKNMACAIAALRHKVSSLTVQNYVDSARSNPRRV